MLDAIMFAHEEIKKIVEFIDAIVAEVGITKQPFEPPVVPVEIEEDVKAFAEEKFDAAIRIKDKKDRENALDEVEIPQHSEEQAKELSLQAHRVRFHVYLGFLKVWPPTE